MITESIVERTIKGKGIDDSDVNECAKAECEINREYDEGKTIENFTWAVEASVMGPEYNIHLNQRYRYDGYPGFDNLGPCWGTEEGVMCQRY